MTGNASILHKALAAEGVDGASSEDIHARPRDIGGALSRVSFRIRASADASRGTRSAGESSGHPSFR